MPIRVKTFCIVTATICFMMGIVFFLADRILRQRSEIIEQEQVRDDVSRAYDALLNEVSAIDQLTFDWAPWDETYEFARTRTTDFVERHLTHGELLNQGKSFIVFTDPSGAIIYSQGLTLSQDGEAPVLETLLKAIAAADVLVKHPGFESAVKGLVAVPECLVLITSRPILKDNYEGPVAGSLIIGTYLSPPHLKALAKNTRLSIAIDHTPEAALGPGAPALDDIEVLADSSDHITGRRLLLDVNGKPCAVLSVKVSRVLHKQYLKSLWIFEGAFFAIVLITGVIIFFFAEFFALSRLSRLHAFIRGIQSTERLSDRLALGGRDEITAIGDGINSMLEKLERDVDRRTQAEQAMQVSEERYRNIFESFMDVYYRTDAGGIITNLSPSIKKLSGWDPEDLIGKPVINIYQDPAERERLMILLTEKGLANDFETTLISKNGNLMPVSVCCHVRLDSQGSFVGVEGSIRDITERRRTEEKIRQQFAELEETNRRLQSEMIERERFAAELLKTERQLENLIENSLDPIIIADESGYLTQVNRAFLDMLGFGMEEVLGKHVTAFIINETGVYETSSGEKVVIDEAFVAWQLECMARFMLEGKGINWKIYYRNKDEKIIPVNSNMIFLFNDQGVRTASCSIIRNITDEVLAEAKLIRAKEAAEQANRAKTAFLANMSHEIRTPLNGIVGMTEIILDTGLDDNQREIMGTITTEVNSLHGIINSILDFSKIEAGKLELDVMPFDVRVMVEDVAASFAARAYQKSLELSCFISPEIPPHLIGDPGRLKQILRNLIGNALKFTHAGEISISAKLAEDFSETIMLRFEIKDTGIGIPEDKQASIFESFTQVDSSTTRKYGGTGLGTTIAKQLVELMGGKIGLESTLGQGSTFFFTVVFQKQAEFKAAPELYKAPGLAGIRVLVVDDNRTNRLILTEYLKSWRCLSAEAAGGQEALCKLNEALLAAEPFGLILMDVHMPDMDGFDTSREIRQIPGLQDIPIVILTSGGWRGDGITCKDLKISGYLTKPVRRNELYDVCVTVLGKGTEVQEAPQIITRHILAEDNRQKVQILLAEDYPVSQKAVMRHLQSAGYHVDVASDGRQALAAARLKQYDLIFMDVQMPDMDGFESTAGIRANEAKISTHGNAVHVPIIAMTAHAMKGYRELCLEGGMDDYLPKPVRKDDVIAMVKTWTGKGTGTRLPDAGLVEQTGEHALEPAAAPQSPAADPSSAEPAPMDYARALDEYDGDREFLMELVSGFLDKARGQIKTIRLALAEGNADAVKKESHAMKGGAGILTAAALSEVARELETMGKSGELTTGAEVLARLERELQRLAMFVEKV